MNKTQTTYNHAHNSKNAVLTLTALALALLLILQIGWSPFASPAVAGDVSSIGDYTALTADAGGSEDILATIDRRHESLLVYGASRNRLELLQAYDLKIVFAQARAAVRK